MISNEIFLKLLAYVGTPLAAFLGIWIFGKVKKSQGVEQGRSSVVNSYNETAHQNQVELFNEQREVLNDYETHIQSSDDWTDDELRNAEKRHGKPDKKIQ